jgi:hypothetical protein
MPTIIILASGGCVQVEQSIKLVQAHIERRVALMSLTNAVDGSRVLISPARVEKVFVHPEPPPSPPTPFPRWAAQTGSSADFVETPGDAPIR